MHGFPYCCLDVLFFSLECDFLNDLLRALLLHVELGAEISVFCLQKTYAELRSVVFTFVLYLETPDFIAGEKILEDHFCLVL